MSRLHPNDMSREERLFLVNLNHRLAEIEKQLKKEAMSLIALMNERVADEADWINDYEIEGTITFWLDENDPKYIVDKDNILATVETSVSLMRIAPEYLKDRESNNWNEWHIHDIDKPDKEEHHCHLYHQLSEHSGLRWEDLLRIGSIWVDINLRLQHIFELESKSTGP